MATAKEKPGEQGLAERLEAEAVAASLRKRQTGGTLSQTEVARIAKFEKHRKDMERAGTFQAITQKELTWLLGVHRMQVRRWETAGMPRNADRAKTYDLTRVLPWLRDRLTELHDDKHTGNSNGKGEEHLAALREVKADRERFKLDQERGRFLDKADVERGRVERIIAVRRGLEGMGKQLGPMVAGMTPSAARKVIDDRVRELLNRFASGKA